MCIPPDQDSDDPWTLLPCGVAAFQPEPERPVLQVDTIEGVEPLDTQIGVFPKKIVSDALHDALFGQQEPTAAEIEAAGGDPAAVPPMQTYAILDAAKLTNLPELLERSGLEHRCLFKDDAYDELKNVAPWIVRLEEDNAFTRHLFTRSEANWHLWDKAAGIYVRSRGSLDVMWRHLRKFTRVQDEDGQWFYGRFWESYATTVFAPMIFAPTSSEASPVAMIIIRTEVDVSIIKASGQYENPPPRIVTREMKASLAAARMGRIAESCLHRATRLFSPHNALAAARLNDYGANLLTDLHRAGIKRENDWMIFLGLLALKGIYPRQHELKSVSSEYGGKRRAELLRHIV